MKKLLTLLLLLGTTSLYAQFFGPAHRVQLSPPVTFATLPSALDGTMLYCSDCTSASPTAGGGTGAIVKMENGSWNGGGGSGSGATLALDNLASVAINTSLLPGTDGASNLGSASLTWGSVFVSATGGVSWGASGDFLKYSNGVGPVFGDSSTGKTLTQNVQSLTANRAVTWPNSGGTVALTTSNVATATALAANGADCSAGNYPLGVDASGAVENCTAAPAAGVTGTGTLNVIPRITNATGPVIGDSAITDNGTTVALSRSITGSGTANRFGTATTNDTAADTMFSASATGARPLVVQVKSGSTTDGISLEKSDLTLLASIAETGGSNTPGNGGQFRVGTGTGATNGGGYASGLGVFFGNTSFGTGLAYNGTIGTAVSSDGLQVGSAMHLCWNASSTIANQTYDLCASRDAAGTLRIAGGTAGTSKGSVVIIADANGGKRSNASSSELLTLSLASTSTATSATLATANSDVEAILARVTTTILTSTDWSVAVTSGIASCTNAWVAIGTTTTAQTGLTSGTTVIFKPAAGLQCHVGTASTLTVTVTGIATAGIIRLTPVVKTYTAPTS